MTNNTLYFAVRGLTFICFLIPLANCNANAQEFDNSIPIVLTPTRLRQSIVDVPASVTIITAEMMQRFGIRSIPDALRLVPGMAVTQITGNNYRINYHGTNILVPRRMNVLVDGISVYGLRILSVDWKSLPVAIENIDRIEVTRGSDSATYGANSMLAIINIITKHPKEVEGTTLKALGGSLGTAEGLVQHGGKIGESTAYRITASREQDNGFDYASTMLAGHDTTRVNKVNFRSITDITDNETLDFQASFIKSDYQVEFVDSSQQGFPDATIENYLINGTWKRNISAHHALQIQGYVTNQDIDQHWRSCLPAATLLPELFTLSRSNPRYAQLLLAGRTPSGGTPQDDALAATAAAAMLTMDPSARSIVCVDANQDYTERRYDVELQDTFVFSPSLRMVSGVGVRYDRTDSETFFGGQVTNKTWRAFANAEYKPSAIIAINAGGFWERDDLTGHSFSPRLALNTHLKDNHTLRLVVSKAVRMPDMLEQRTDWTYRTTNYSRPVNSATDGYFFRTASSPGNLTGEKILSREIGYLGNFPKHGILLDVKVFDDRLTNLISEKLQNSDFSPTNNNSVRLRGAEVQLTYAPSSRWMAHLGYALLDNDASNAFEQTQYAKHSGSLAISHMMPHGWWCSFAYYGYGAATNGQTFYGREDLTLSKTFRPNKYTSISPSFTISHLDNRSSTYLNGIGKIRESRYDNAMQYYLALKLTF